MGTGRFNNIPETDDGCSWAYRGANQTNSWTVTSLPSGVTSSYYGNNLGGANWYTSSVSQSFNYFSAKDININVTSIVAAWTSSLIPNNGFIIRNTGSIEFDYNYQYTFDFFSRDTNTIYPPCLEFKWKDSTFNPGSTSYVNNNNILVSLSNNKPLESILTKLCIVYVKSVNVFSFLFIKVSTSFAISIQTLCELTKDLPIKPSGKNEFIRSGQTCSNGADMYVYIQGVPTTKGGLPMNGLVPGFLLDSYQAFNVNALIDTMTNNAYPECKQAELPIGMAGSREKEKRWIESRRISKQRYDCTPKTFAADGTPIKPAPVDPSCAFVENFTNKTPVAATAITLCILTASYFLFCK
jgi:hypothetical protein